MKKLTAYIFCILFVHCAFAQEQAMTPLPIPQVDIYDSGYVTAPLAGDNSRRIPNTAWTVNLFNSIQLVNANGVTQGLMPRGDYDKLNTLLGLSTPDQYGNPTNNFTTSVSVTLSNTSHWGLSVRSIAGQTYDLLHISDPNGNPISGITASGGGYFTALQSNSLIGTGYSGVQTDAGGNTTRLGYMPKNGADTNANASSYVPKYDLDTAKVNIYAALQPAKDTSIGSGIVAYYRLDDGSGNAIDATGHFNATGSTGITYGVAGKLGTAYSFNGSTSNVQLGNVSSSAVFTFAAWINTSAGVQTIIGSTGNGDGGMWFRVNSNGTIALSKTGIADVANSTGTITNGTYNYVAVTYDANGNYVYYINGQPSGNGTNLLTFNLSANYAIGYFGGSYTMNGSIDELLISNKVLTPTQILSLYNVGAGKTATNTLGFTPENISNKISSITSPNNITYPSTQGMVSYFNANLPTVIMQVESYSDVQNVVAIAGKLIIIKVLSDTRTGPTIANTEYHLWPDNTLNYFAPTATVTR